MPTADQIPMNLPASSLLGRIESERAIIDAMRRLPIAIIITPRADSLYIWQCVDANGTAPTLASALSSEVNYLIGRIAGDEAVIDDLP